MWNLSLVQAPFAFFEQPLRASMTNYMLILMCRLQQIREQPVDL